MDVSKKPRTVEVDMICQERQKPLLSDEGCGYDEESILHL
jgi:hypothetical protein